MVEPVESEVRVWRAAAWLVVFAFLGTGVWWFFKIPSVGKGGILLAVGATLMPLFWEKVGTTGKMSWIAMLFVLLAVEYRAIDKEQADAAKQQQEALATIGSGFTTVLTSQQQSFSTLILQSQTNFNSLIRDERDNFSRMMANNIQAQRRENTNFSVLLNQEKELLIKQEELYDFTSNKLLPASDPTPANNCRASVPDDVFVFLGTHGNTFFWNRFPHSVLQIHDHDVISIDRGEGGSLVLSVDMRDKSGKIIANLSKNGFIVSKTYELYMLRPDKNTVIIEDGYGREILKARFLNPRAFALEGIIQYGDRTFPLEMQGFSGGCFGHSKVTDIGVN